MQQKHFFFLGLIVVLISLCSCKKDSTEPTNTLTYDGFTYHTVTIPGAGTWTVENARNTHFLNGKLIRNAKTNAEWNDSTNVKINTKTSDVGAWCYYNNANGADTQSRYGKLYNWYAVNDPAGFAPKDWHVATDSDFTKLKTVLGDSAGQKLKSVLYWTGDAGSNNPKRDSTKFTAVPAGFRDDIGAFTAMGSVSYFWASTASGANFATYHFLNNFDAKFSRDSKIKLLGASVRFVRN